MPRFVLGFQIGNIMDLQLQNKHALVTGSTGGIGLAIAVALAREGAILTVNGRTKKRVDEAIAAVTCEAPAAIVQGIAADLSTAEGVERLVRSLPTADILVNNLGIYGATPFFDISDAEWLRFFETNVMSGVRLSRAYLGRMLKQNWGRIVFISSESGVNIPAEMIHYGMTKTAQIAIARGMAELTAGTNVTVNSVLVGPTRSEGVADFITGVAKQQGKTAADVEREFFQNVRPSSLLKRFEEPDEIAALVAFICSPLSRATNGAAVRADGGVVRSIL
jgi:NAD(P)-dependent dehydrogenase (short-subunit alcohol dehydrogenase family)